MDRTLLIEPHYFPSLAYFSLLSQVDEVILEVKEHYSRQSYRNRCYILGANGLIPLSIPVIKGAGKTRTDDVRIDNNQRWMILHWRSIQSAYGKAPFFEHFSGEFYEILAKKYIFLIDLHEALIEKCLTLLGFDHVKIRRSEGYSKYAGSDITDMRDVIHPKKRLKNQFFYNPVRYTQLFGNMFVENLSILDLLFCQGNTAGKIIRDATLL